MAHNHSWFLEQMLMPGNSLFVSLYTPVDSLSQLWCLQLCSQVFRSFTSYLIGFIYMAVILALFWVCHWASVYSSFERIDLHPWEPPTLFMVQTRSVLLFFVVYKLYTCKHWRTIYIFQERSKLQISFFFAKGLVRQYSQLLHLMIFQCCFPPDRRTIFSISVSPQTFEKMFVLNFQADSKMTWLYSWFHTYIGTQRWLVTLLSELCFLIVFGFFL